MTLLKDICKCRDVKQYIGITILLFTAVIIGIIIGQKKSLLLLQDGSNNIAYIGPILVHVQVTYTRNRTPAIQW